MLMVRSSRFGMGEVTRRKVDSWVGEGWNYFRVAQRNSTVSLESSSSLCFRGGHSRLN